MQRRWMTFFTASLAMLLMASPALAQESMSVFKMYFWSDNVLGLIITWVIISMSVVTMALVIHFLLKYRKATLLPEMTYQNIDAMISEKRYREAIDFASADPSFLASITSAALNEAANGYGAMERALEEHSELEIARMLRPIEWLNILGNIAPMMGLFGTVFGMIVAFQTLVEAGGRPDPAKLAAGISTALVTTFWGLLVAMPALFCYSFVRNRIDAISTETVIAAEELISQFKPGGKKKTSSEGGSPSGRSSRPMATPKPTAER